MPAGFAILFANGLGLTLVLGLLVAFIIANAPTRQPSADESPGFPIEPTEPKVK